MAHARTTDQDARVIDQCARGRRVRNIESVPFVVANARTNMTDPNHVLADVILNTTTNKAVFVAPCDGKVLRVYANAAVYPTQGAGSVTIKATKAVIGGTDVDLCSALTISGGTAETALDATLSTTSGALDLIEGQLVYAVIVVSNNAVTARSDAAVLGVEWIPQDKSV